MKTLFATRDDAAKVIEIFQSRMLNRPIPFREDGDPWRSAAEFEGKEEKKQEWIIQDFVPRGEVTLLAGDGGLNKSTVMLYLCAAVVEAQTTYPKKWMGQPVAPGRALFLSCEDPAQIIQRRLNRYCDEEGCRLSELASLEWRSIIEQDTELVIEDPKTRKIEPTPLYHALRTRIEETRPALVVIENASDVFGGNENDRTGGVSKSCCFALCSYASVRYAEATEAPGDPPCPASTRPSSAACLPA